MSETCIPGNWLYHYDADVYTSPDVFPKYLSSVYFSIMTLSTIGYGDIVPVNFSPKFLSSVYLFSPRTYRPSTQVFIVRLLPMGSPSTYRPSTFQTRTYGPSNKTYRLSN